MILFTILVLILVLLLVFIAIMASALGASIIIVFGDVIVCAILIIWIIKKLIKGKK